MRRTDDAFARAFRIAACVLGACLAAPQARAEKALDTDGPDFVESSEAVGKDRFQFEAGAASERDRGGPAGRTSTSTPTLLRFGVTETIEARVETAGRIRNASESIEGGPGSVETGSGDVALGLKWHSQDRDSATGKPAISWLAHVDTPTGSDGLRGHGIRPSLRSVITWDLPGDLSLGLMPGLKYDADPEGRRFLAGILGVVLNERVTQRFRAFVEVSGEQIAKSRDGGVLLFWDAGAAYLMSEDWQIGVRAAVAANRNTPDRALLFALAGRF
jgi:hypothetical protein